MSVFNQRLYARRNDLNRIVVLAGDHRFQLTADGLSVTR
jgi:hypothetical protein